MDSENKITFAHQKIILIISCWSWINGKSLWFRINCSKHFVFRMLILLLLSCYWLFLGGFNCGGRICYCFSIVIIRLLLRYSRKKFNSKWWEKNLSYRVNDDDDLWHLLYPNPMSLIFWYNNDNNHNNTHRESIECIIFIPWVILYLSYRFHDKQRKS